VQAHSLITVLEFTFAFAILNFPYKSPARWLSEIKNYFILGLPALGLGLPQLIPFLARASKESFYTLVPIWADDRRTFFSLWWKGLGVFWALSLFHCWLTLDRRQIMMYLPGLFVFGVSNLVHYQPWNLDNTKVFYNGWIPLAVAAVAHFLVSLKRTGFGRGLMFLLIVSANLSASIGLFKAVVSGGPLWDREDVYRLADWAIANTPPKSVWATDSHHTHPIATLAGRQILVGYRGWMGSHHLNEEPRVRAMEKLGESSERTELIDRFHVDYICFCPAGPDELAFRFHRGSIKWSQVFVTENYEVWKRNPDRVK
jgi:hypothetical protein